MSTTTAAPARCESCGVHADHAPYGELSCSDAAGAPVCLNCHDRAAAKIRPPAKPPAAKPHERSSAVAPHPAPLALRDVDVEEVPSKPDVAESGYVGANPLQGEPQSQAYARNTEETEGEKGKEPGTDLPEMRRLLAMVKDGRIRREDVPLVPLGEMPPDATAAMSRIAADMQLRMGLQRSVDDDLPLIYAYSEAVRAGQVRTNEQAGRAIRRLVEAGVIERAGELPRRPGVRYRTRLPS